MGKQYEQSITARHTKAVNMAVEHELNKALEKFPKWPTDFVDSVAIMAEESGETVKAALQYKWEGKPKHEIYKEAAQTAAMCFRVMVHILDSEATANEAGEG